MRGDKLRGQAGLSCMGHQIGAGLSCMAIKQDLLMNVVWPHRSQFFVAIQFRWQGCNFLCGTNYLPTTGRPINIYEARLAEVKELIHQARDIDYFIIGGEFNFVGGSWMADGYTWGQWWPLDREPHQRTVATSGWAQRNNLKESTMWHENRTPRTTRRGRRGQSSNALDYLFASHDLETKCIRTHFVDDVLYDYDHAQVIMEYNAPHPRRRVSPEDLHVEKENGAFREYINASKSTMRDGWDKEKYDVHMQEFAQQTNLECIRDPCIANTDFVRAMRYAALQQRRPHRKGVEHHLKKMQELVERSATPRDA